MGNQDENRLNPNEMVQMFKNVTKYGNQGFTCQNQRAAAKTLKGTERSQKKVYSDSAVSGGKSSELTKKREWGKEGDSGKERKYLGFFLKGLLEKSFKGYKQTLE